MTRRQAPEVKMIAALSPRWARRVDGHLLAVRYAVVTSTLALIAHLVKAL